MANRMGHAIVDRRGTEAEAVAILLDNGARLMAAMLAVLKAGKFFVLLDKSSPKARLDCILEDSQAHLIISEREHGEVTRRLINADSNLLDFESISSRVAEENLGLTFRRTHSRPLSIPQAPRENPKGLFGLIEICCIGACWKGTPSNCPNATDCY